MINNRQAGRRRGRGGQQQRSSGGNPGRQDSGNRIDNRARGNAAQLLEKYKTLARDAQMQGDRVNVEYYLQFADHYFRVLAETRARFEENGGAVSTRRIQGATLDEDEPDYEDEGERVEQPQADQNRPEQNRGQNRDGQSRDGQQRDGQNRDGQQRGYRNDGRQDGNRGYNQNGNGQRDQYAASDGRGDQQRGNGQEYDNRARVNGNANGAEGGYDRQAEAPATSPSATSPSATSKASARCVATATSRPTASHLRPNRSRSKRRSPLQPTKLHLPKRRAGAVVARAAKWYRWEAEAPAFENVGFMAERLPPSLTVSAVADPDGEELAEKPRRRRGRPPASAATTAE